MGAGLHRTEGGYKSLGREVTNQRRPCDLSSISELIKLTVKCLRWGGGLPLRRFFFPPWFLSLDLRGFRLWPRTWQIHVWLRLTAKRSLHCRKKNYVPWWMMMHTVWRDEGPLVLLPCDCTSYRASMAYRVAWVALGCLFPRYSGKYYKCIIIRTMCMLDQGMIE